SANRLPDAVAPAVDSSRPVGWCSGLLEYSVSPGLSAQAVAAARAEVAHRPLVIRSARVRLPALLNNTNATSPARPGLALYQPGKRAASGSICSRSTAPEGIAVC